VDGALDQFTAQNYDSHDDIHTSLTPNGETILSLVIASPGDDEYAYYTGARPVHPTN
jgi:hypothetical protein